MKKKITLMLLGCFALLAMTNAQTTTPGKMNVTVADTVAIVTTEDVKQILLFIQDKVKNKTTVAEWQDIEMAVSQLVAVRKKQWAEGKKGK